MLRRMLLEEKSRQQAGRLELSLPLTGVLWAPLSSQGSRESGPPSPGLASPDLLAPILTIREPTETTNSLTCPQRGPCWFHPDLGHGSGKQLLAIAVSTHTPPKLHRNGLDGVRSGPSVRDPRFLWRQTCALARAPR